MKVLQLNCVYPYGSTGKITEAIHRRLESEGYESVVLYGRGHRCFSDHAVKVCGELSGKLNHAITLFTGLKYGGCAVQTNRILRLIKEMNPDVVHLQCINGYFVNIYRLVSYLREAGIPTVLTLHAEFMYTANCDCAFDCQGWKTGCKSCDQFRIATDSVFFNRTKKSFELMRKSFEGFSDSLVVVGVSDWLSARARLSPIMEKVQVRTIRNGVDTDVFHPCEKNKIRKELGLANDEVVVLWVTSAFSEAKGRSYFTELVSMCSYDKYRFVVAGAKRPENYNGKAVFLGSISDANKLAEIYSASDVVLCCSKQESLPTTVLEAQCCGTPVVGFDVGGVSEALYPGMGCVVPLGDIGAMMDAVENWSCWKAEGDSALVDSCRDALSFNHMTADYLSIYQALM